MTNTETETTMTDRDMIENFEVGCLTHGDRREMEARGLMTTTPGPRGGLDFVLTDAGRAILLTVRLEAKSLRDAQAAFAKREEEVGLWDAMADSQPTACADCGADMTEDECACLADDEEGR